MAIPFLATFILGNGRLTWFLLLIALTLFWLVPRLTKLGLQRVRVQYRLSAQSTFPDEPVHVAVELENAGRWPLAWLSVEERIAYPLETPSSASWVQALAPRERVRREYPLVARRRGVYPLGTLYLSSGDSFGIARFHKRWEFRRRLICYPRVYPVGIDLTGRIPLGPRTDRRSLFTDPEQISSLRPYTPADPLRNIAWKVSAHSGEWLVKEHPTVRERSLAFFLNLDPRDTKPVPAAAAIEQLVSMAASFIWAERDSNCAIGLWAVASAAETQALEVRTASSEGIVAYPLREGIRARTDLLEALAVLGPAEGDFAALFEGEGSKLPHGTTVVGLISAETERLVLAAQRLAREGKNVYLLSMTDPRPEWSSPRTVVRGRVLAQPSIQWANQ